MTEFRLFAQSVHGRLMDMAGAEMFVVETTDIFASYLAAFPEGSNPIHRTRTVHDCSCCKSFIRNFGRTCSIVGGQRKTVWGDGSDLPSPYREVAAQMNAIIMQAPIAGVFRTKERSYGTQTTVEMINDNAHRWYHFHGKVAPKHHSARPDEERGALAATGHVLRRGLTELSTQAVETVIELIESESLYRGAEFLEDVRSFARLQREFATAADQDLVVWSNLQTRAARLRNTAMGTLLQDLSEGMDTDRAVRSYETKVAPTNYKRSKSLITPKMVDSALATLAGLGLEDAVNRRFARISDVSVNDVLFVDNSVRGKMRGGLRDMLMQETRDTTTKTEGMPIRIEDFIARVVPNAKAMAVHLKNSHLSNFLSITAPEVEGSGRIFKWSNGFAWSYDGDVADSIKERVKRAGGNTKALLRVSLAWSNYDDLDIRATCPEGQVYYGNKMGILDVDMNVSNYVRDPVENLSWSKPRDGAYKIAVNQFNQRETKDVGFTIEVECNGAVQQFSSATSPDGREMKKCIEFTMKNGQMSDLKVVAKNLHGGSIPTEKWGVKTETQVKVDSFMTSPNHWEGAGEVGAKHWIFVLDGCRNPDAARGIYNEFLRGDLTEHRKVFEVLGAKSKCPPSDQQLSGIGFTQGRGDRVLVRVDADAGSRLYDISF